jgi:hypothetical protein
MLRPSPELILREVDVPVEPNKHSVSPDKSRVADESVKQTGLGIKVGNGVVLEVAGVDEAVRVGVHAVLEPGFAAVLDCATSLDLGVAGAVEEVLGWYRVELTSAGCGVEELGVVG